MFSRFQMYFQSCLVWSPVCSQCGIVQKWSKSQLSSALFCNIFLPSSFIQHSSFCLLYPDLVFIPPPAQLSCSFVLFLFILCLLLHTRFLLRLLDFCTFFFFFCNMDSFAPFSSLFWSLLFSVLQQDLRHWRLLENLQKNKAV